MTTCFLAPDPIQSTQFIPGGNTPANGGKLFFYAAGSSTKQTAYKDSAAAVSWANPIVLDSGGNLPSGGEVWFPAGQTFKVVFAPANDTDPPASPYWSKDNLSGVNDVAAQLTEWVSGPTPTFISTTSFTVAGDQRTTFTVGRRVKTANTGGTVYSTIVTSIFTTLTTVTVVNDSSVLDAGLSAVFYGLMDPANPSIDFYHVARDGGTVAAAATTDIWGIKGTELHITGTTAIQSFSSAAYAGATRIVISDGTFPLSSSAVLNIPGGNVTTSPGDRFEVLASTATNSLVTFYQKASGAPLNMSAVSSAIATNVAMSNTALYFDGPAVAQSTTGTWFACGNVTVTDSAGAAAFTAKLWDGTTVIASVAVRAETAIAQKIVSLCGFMTNPSGNLRISVKDATSTNGIIYWNNTGNSTDSYISALRIG